MNTAEKLRKMRDDAQFNDIVQIFTKHIKREKNSATKINYMNVTDYTQRKLINEGFTVESIDFHGYKTTQISL